MVTPTNASGGPVDETAVLPPVRPQDARPTDGRAAGPVGGSAGDETAVLPQVPQGSQAPHAPQGAADETAVLPPVRPEPAADETAVLPPVRDERGRGPEDRVPPGYRTDRTGASDGGTRELPQVDAEGRPRRRPRSDWAEETPLDDLPTLADELLGPREDDERDGQGEGNGQPAALTAPSGRTSAAGAAGVGPRCQCPPAQWDAATQTTEATQQGTGATAGVTTRAPWDAAAGMTTHAPSNPPSGETVG